MELMRVGVPHQQSQSLSLPFALYGGSGATCFSSSSSLNSHVHDANGYRPITRLKLRVQRRPQQRRKTNIFSRVVARRDSDDGMSPPFNVLITGASKGIGYALAKEFLRSGDNVIICSRSGCPKGHDSLEELRHYHRTWTRGIGHHQANDHVNHAVQSLKSEFGDHVWGTTCDVRDGKSVQALVKFAKSAIGHVDIWINNAGSNAYSYKPLVEMSDDLLMEVVTTNTIGSMICCREAITMMMGQSFGGHIFNMDGAGSDGRPTPRFAAYGATKRSVVHLTKSLQAELKMQSIKKVILHNLSPGMVTTDLLMTGCTTKQAKFFVNVLAETPDTVAKYLVPRIRNIPSQAFSNSTYIRFLSGFKAYLQIFLRLAFGARKNKYLTEE